MPKKKKRKLKNLMKQTDDDRLIPLSALLSGAYPISASVREDIQNTLDAVMATSCEVILIEEARGYGYPLKNLVDFYLQSFQQTLDAPEGFADIDEPFSEGIDLETGTRQNIEYLKSVETWEDFQPVMDSMQEPRASDEPLLVPPDMISLIVDKRMLHALEDTLTKYANEMESTEAVALCAAEYIRTLIGGAVEAGADALEMTPNNYQVFMRALQNRVNADDQMSRELNGINRMNYWKYGGTPQ